MHNARHNEHLGSYDALHLDSRELRCAASRELQCTASRELQCAASRELRCAARKIVYTARLLVFVACRTNQTVVDCIVCVSWKDSVFFFR